MKRLADLPGPIRERSRSVGIDLGGKCRSGSFFQTDHSVIQALSGTEGLEIMSVTDALGKYRWLNNISWGLIRPQADEFTAMARDDPHHGYFIRARAGARITLPLQACLFITRDGLAQNVHNIVVAEEGSEIHIITGCGAAPTVRTGLHVGVTEFYIRAGAVVTSTMIHHWGPRMKVRPRAAALIGEDGVFISSFVSLHPVSSLQMAPAAHCRGAGSVARLASILLAHPRSDLDVGASVYLEAAGSRAEIVSRSITSGGEVTARGKLVAAVPEVRAHLECRGLILFPRGRIRAVPELEGLTHGVDLSHEAAVGRIAEEQLLYLEARGLTEDEATEMIVQGFLDAGVEGLPAELAAEIRRAVRTADTRGM